MTRAETKRPRVGLFVTCLVDLLRPTVAFAAVRLLEAAGCEVGVPEAQTCCGQPAYNGGDKKSARAYRRADDQGLRRLRLRGGAVGLVRGHAQAALPLLMAGDEKAEGRARAFAERVHELTAFLLDVRRLDAVPGTYAGRVAYHDGCSGLRELGVRRQPRELLAKIAGIELVELAERDTCCGFGGLFSVKYPDISNAIVERKTATAAAAAPELLLSGDLGCLMNIAGKLSRQGSAIACRHVAEVLAGETSAPPIAQAAGRIP